MLPRIHPVEAPRVPLGQRRGISDLARIALDLTWAPKRAELDDSARSRAYPSPPMSGSPPFPPKPFQEASERGQPPAGYRAGNPQDAHRGTSSQHSAVDSRGPHSMPPPLPRPYQQEQPEGMQYMYRRPEDNMTRPGPYPQPGVPTVPQQSGYLPAVGPSAPTPYHMAGRQVAEAQQMTSPKSQRKTKGHVASACVPCKRAHLRCDAQRPCSRCITNGKEDSCVDVQHKKRGRPRLRDDRDTRYDPSRFSQPQDATARRPLSIYPSGGSMSSGYKDLFLAEGLNRGLTCQSEQMPPRYLERNPTTDANLYAAHPSIAARVPEPVAFLNMNMEFAKASPLFAEAIGSGSLEGRNLGEIVVTGDRDKVLGIRSQLLEEQTRKEPNYLPPILGRLDHVVQGIGFGAEEIGRFNLDRQEYFTFRTYDGQGRSYAVRIGLAKEGSIYFVVLFLNLPPRHPYQPPPSPLSRDSATPQLGYGPRTPVSATFDPARQRYSEGSFGSRTPSQMPLTPGMGVGASYAASPSRQEYPGPRSYHIPRSELTTPVQPRPQAYQLPPIRAQPGQGEPSGEHGWPREERTGRVDIGGLIERPDAPGRPR